MKFNAYFVALKHEELHFTGRVSLGNSNLQATFTRVDTGLYTAHFKQQIFLRHHQFMRLGNRDIPGDVLLPVLSKYNKRKLRKIAHILQTHPDPDPGQIVLLLLEVDRFLEAGLILDFYAISHAEMLQRLVQSELRGELKLIETLPLLVTSQDSLARLRKSMREWLEAKREKSTRAIPLTHLEFHLKIPHSSLLFRYLLFPETQSGTFRLLDDQITFPRQGLSVKEKENIRLIEEEVQRRHKVVFSIDDLLHTSGLSYPSINSALWFLLNEEQVVRLNERDFVFQADLAKIINRLKKFKRNQGDMIDIATFRELTALSRRAIIPLLEYMDTRQITARTGDRRRILLTV
ncbi:MAG TPA: hypothetical protein ENN40_08565 [Candidatus Aminicenantes bacterium]|nr:hypothetical protein [Candidatus Aminicenantes bacterium]